MKALLILLLCGCLPADSATYHVNAATGNDALAAGPWKTLNRAATQVVAGDTVLVAPGVYLEFVKLARNGTAGKPITFRAEGSVIISGAVPALRKMDGAWKLENAALQLYSTLLTNRPARVLYDHVDLFPYASINALQAFTVGDKTPGPRHGFAHVASEKKLYVRLHEAGKYGDRDPRRHTMKVSPPSGTGGALRQISQPSHYNFGIVLPGANFVILDGFTFETPGVAGVYVRGGNVLVRNCTFLGCRTGVAGNSDSFDENQRTNDVTVEYCSFSQFPTFDDVIEVVDRAQSLGELPAFYWWQRKGGDQTYELGLVLKAGSRWIIRNNRVTDALDALSSWSVGSAKDLEISNNRFERLVDNGVETENNAANVRVFGNWFIDVFEPISWQPLGEPPWPGPVWFYRNVITTTLVGRALWPKLTWQPGCVKIRPKAGSSFPATVPGAGFLFFNNTVHFPAGDCFTLSSDPVSAPGNFHFINNAFAADTLSSVALPNVSGMQFASNFVAPSSAGQPGPGRIFANASGRQFASFDALQFTDPAKLNFAPKPGSPLLAAGIARPDLPGSSRDVGAISKGSPGTPPETGPRAIPSL